MWFVGRSESLVREKSGERRVSIINTAMRPDSLHSVATPYFESRETTSSQARQRKSECERDQNDNADSNIAEK